MKLNYFNFCPHLKFPRKGDYAMMSFHQIDIILYIFDSKKAILIYHKKVSLNLVSCIIKSIFECLTPWCPASAGCCCMVSSPPPRAPPCTSTPPCCRPCWCSTGASAASPGSCPSGSGLTDPCWGGSHWGGGCYWRSCSRGPTEGCVIVRVMTKIYSCVLNLFHYVHFNCFCRLGCVSRVKILTLAKTWRIDGDRHGAWTWILI